MHIQYKKLIEQYICHLVLHINKENIVLYSNQSNLYEKIVQYKNGAILFQGSVKEPST